MSGCLFCKAIANLLPGTVVARRVARDWHSATFSGQRLVITLHTDADHPALAEFVQTISDHEFALAGILVADIAVTAHSGNADGSTHLILEALLLDEEI